MYGTILDGNAYMDTYVLNSDVWDTATDPDKLIVLNQGTEIIDRLNYKGKLADPDQAEQFPRGTDTTVPVDIERANYLIALELLDGWDSEIEFENTNLRERKYAQAKTTYTTEVPLRHIIAGVPSSRAWRYMLPYLRDADALNLYRVS